MDKERSLLFVAKIANKCEAMLKKGIFVDAQTVVPATVDKMETQNGEYMRKKEVILLNNNDFLYLGFSA